MFQLSPSPLSSAPVSSVEYPAVEGDFVAVLYAREDSIYKSLSAHVYDINRDARNYNGPYPVVAHPPCRAWGRLRHFAKPRPDEKALAFHAVHAVRTWGGVLEHPESSSLWIAAQLPRPGEGRDDFGGFTYVVDQSWFGHRAPKRTWLYIVGAVELPPVPFHLGLASGRVINMDTKEREATPYAFAEWLLDLATSCGKGFTSGSFVIPGLCAPGCSKSSFVIPGLSLTGETIHPKTSSRDEVF